MSEETVTENARSEAERRWPSYPTVGFSGAEDRQTAFRQGAEWQASRPVTDEQVEAVLSHRWHVPTGRCACGQNFATEKAFILHTLEAARGVQS